MAEQLVQDEGAGLPICIVRPSIVVSTWKVRNTISQRCYSQVRSMCRSQYQDGLTTSTVQPDSFSLLVSAWCAPRLYWRRCCVFFGLLCSTNPSGRWTWTASLWTRVPTSPSLQPGRLTRTTPTGKTISRWRLSWCSPDPKYIVFAGVQPHLKQHCAFEVGRDLRHSEGLPDEEPSWGDGLVPGGQLQTESCHQQVRTISLSHF